MALDQALMGPLQQFVGAAPPSIDRPLSADELLALQQFAGTPTLPGYAPSPVPGFTNALPSPGMSQGAEGAEVVPQAPPEVPMASAGNLPGAGGSGSAGTEVSTPVAVPSSPPKPRQGGPVVSQDEVAARSAFDKAQKANEEAAQAGQDAATAEASFFEEQQRQQQARAAKEAQNEAQRQKALEDHEGQVNQALSEWNKPDAKVDGRNWWGNQSTGGKILAGLSLAFGSLGSLANAAAGQARDPNMRNSGVDFVMQAIDKDIQLQREAVANERERRRGNLQGKQTLYQMARGRFGDQRDAEAVARAGAIQLAQAELNRLGAKEKSETRKAAATQASAQLDMELQKTLGDMRNRQSQQWLQRQQLGLDQRRQSLGEAQFGLEVSRAKAGPGMNKDTATLINGVEERARNMKTRIGELKTLVSDKGTFETFGAHEEKLEAAVQDIAVDYAKLLDPGSVAREGEVAMARKLLFEPGTLKKSNKTVLEVLSNFERNLENRRLEAYRVRGLPPPADTSDRSVAGRLGAGVR